jgi:hypothetical protein
MKTKSASQSAFFNPRVLIGLVLCSIGLLLALVGWSKSVTSMIAVTGTANPAPLINQPLLPDAVTPGGSGFTLTVNGTGFVSGASVNWNGGARTTTFVSNSQVTAAILASDIAAASTASVTVVSPSPGGGISNTIFFPIRVPTSSVALSRSDIHNSVPGVPIGIATADFNHDGKLDLAVGNGCCGGTHGDTVSILIGNGDGTFQPQVDYATAGEPNGVAVADLNRDGNIDLVTSDYTPGKVSVLLGNGDGTFRAHADYATGDLPDVVIIGDFNRDGILDLATANPGPGFCCGTTVSILLGKGDGTFRRHVDFVAGNVPNNLVTGDFNRDGNLDLAVTKGHSDSVAILLGNGDGTFQASVDYPAGSCPGFPVAVDFNADGNLDLAISDGCDNVVSVLVGNGDGTFNARVNYPAGEGAAGTGTADFNGDGILDLVLSNGVSGTLSIFLGNGDGTFQTRVDYPWLTGGGLCAPGDFNADGSLDLAVPAGTSDVVSIFLQIPVVSQECLPPPAGLISWWSGDKTADDLKGTNNGTLLNGTSFRKGMVGPAFSFDGVNDYVQIPHNASLNPGTGDFSVNFWMKTDTLDTQLALLSKRDVCNAVSFWGLVMLADGTIEVEIYDGLININTFSSDISVNDEIWHHVALVRQTTTATLYIDGAVHGSGSTEGITLVANTAPVRFATDVCVGVNGSTQFYSGELDEIQYLNAALTSSQVQDIYNAGAVGQCKPEIFVSSIDPSYTVVHSQYLVTTSVAIEDTNGVGISGATVKVKTILPSGSELIFPAQTNESGIASFSFYTTQTGLYKFKIMRVSLPGRDYNPQLNIETTDTLLIP